MPGYSISAKKRKAIIHDLYNTDKSLRQIAKENRISHTTVMRYRDLYKSPLHSDATSIETENISNKDDLDKVPSKENLYSQYLELRLDTYFIRLTELQKNLYQHKKQFNMKALRWSIGVMYLPIIMLIILVLYKTKDL